jgi:hypothetical protein
LNKLYATIVIASASWMLCHIGVGVYNAAREHELDIMHPVDYEFDPVQQAEKPWRKTVATYYGNPYDANPSRYRTSDGTPYRSDGAFCATYLVPLGTQIEVRRGDVTLTLTVRDRPAKRNGRKLDIPTKTWDKLGAKRSIGVLPVEWRVK